MNGFDIQDGQINFRFEEMFEEPKINKEFSIFNMSSTNENQFFFDAESHTNQVSEEEKQKNQTLKEKKGPRNNQNHVRGLNRKILKKSCRTYKIHKLQDKRVTIALCRLQYYGGNLENIQNFLQSNYSNLGQNSKDIKMKQHIKFICQLDNSNFENDEQVLHTLVEFWKVGQDKGHPIDSDKFSLESYLKIEEQVRLSANN